MPILRLSDKKENGALSFDLIDILNVMPGTAHDLKWSIVDFDFVEGNLKQLKTTVTDIKIQARASREGYVLSWLKLVEIAKRLFQSVDALIVGYREIGQLPLKNRANFRELCQTCDVVIQAFDSIYWQLSVADPE